MKSLLTTLSISIGIYAAVVVGFLVVSETQLIGSWSIESFLALRPQQRFLFLGLGIMGILIVAALGFLSYFLAVRRQRKMVLVLSIILLTAIPIGTVLGLVTILVVTRPSARAEFP